MFKNHVKSTAAVINLTVRDKLELLSIVTVPVVLNVIIIAL